MKYINKHNVHKWNNKETITDNLLNNIEESLQDLDDAVGSTEFEGNSISDAIKNLQTTSMRLLTSDELNKASTLLDIAPGRYFTANGAKIKALEPNFPFDIGNSTSYFVIVYKYSSGFKYVRILTVDGKRDFTGWTAATHRTTFSWNDISPDSSTFNPTVKILIFGNSSTYSTWGYAPLLLSEFCPDYNFKIGILYTSGQSLGGHMTMFNNNTAYTEYSVFENGAWKNTANTITGKNALDSDEWDIIAVQQSNDAMMNGTGKADIDGLCALIATYIDYPVQFVMNMPMTKGANCSGLASYYPDIDDLEGKSDAAFADFADYCKDALVGNYISHVIPCGTAIQNARHTALKQYGTFEYLCDDDTGHLQNGIGVLCASYTMAYKILEIIGKKAELFGSSLNPTDDWLTEINLFTKTAHGSCVGVTNENKLLAQQCALQAVKNPYIITSINSPSYHTTLSDTIELVTEDISAAYITPELNVIHQGVTYTYDAEHDAIKLHGTAAATRHLRCLNGQKEIAFTSTAYNKTFEPGIYKFSTNIISENNVSNVIEWHYTYGTSFVNLNPKVLVKSTDGTVQFKFIKEAMVGLSIPTDMALGTKENPTYITFTATRLSAIDSVAREDISTLTEYVRDMSPTTTVGPISVAAVDDATPLNADNVTIAIDPVQDLHGYDHPWPAGGGKNMCPPPVVGWSYHPNSGEKMTDVITAAGTDKFAVNFSLNPNYTVYTNIAVNNMILAWDTNGDFVGRTSGVLRNDRSVVISKNSFSSGGGNGNKDYIASIAVRFYESSDGTQSIQDVNNGFIQIEVGDTYTGYEPYSNICPITGWTGVNIYHSGADTSNPDVITITFPTEADAVYGGTVDLTKGTLTVDKKLYNNLETINWVEGSDSTETHRLWRNSTAFTDRLLKPDFRIMCSKYTTVSGGSYSDMPEDSILISANNKNVYICDSSYATVEAFKASLQDCTIVLKIETPIVYTLDPVTVRLLRGENAIWADTGNITLNYHVDLPKYINIMAGKAHMLCIGDLFFNGAVYNNGQLDHMAAYENTIYGQIASSLKILKEHNMHMMYPSTGLLSAPSSGANGSFLDIITQTSLTSYDYIVTQISGDDINNNNLGSIRSSANDGSIAGGVMALMDYIKTNNGLCRLILLSVPPYSSNSNTSGDKVFSGRWEYWDNDGGYGINDLDNLMYDLAMRLHFTYISWQDLEISYHFVDYATSDSNQPDILYATDDIVYRIMGQYVGLQIAAMSNPIALAKTTRVYTLNYYTYDGSSLLYSEIVFYGGSGDYKGPTPTRGESYTWIGWGLNKKEGNREPDWDPDALKNITANRNVYAAYLSHYA